MVLLQPYVGNVVFLRNISELASTNLFCLPASWITHQLNDAELNDKYTNVF